MIPKVVRNYSLFVDGRGYAGRVETCTLPKLQLKTEEWRGGGMDAPAEIDMGMQKLTCDMSIKEHDPALYRLFGLVSGNAVAVTMRAALQGDTAAPADAYVISLRGLWTELDGGTFKGGESGMLKATMGLRYYRLSIGGKDIVEIDTENMIRRIDGRDVMASIRQALGI